MIKAVIFDMDGVLVDSVSCNIESFRVLLKEYGVDYSVDKHKELIGNSLKDQIAFWKREYNIDEAIDEQEFSRKAFEIQKQLMKYCKIDPGLLVLLNNLKAKKLLMGIGTSSTKSRAETILKSLEIYKYFSTLITAEDVKEYKPNPAIFLSVAKKLKVQPGECVVIEDASSGIEAAKRAGMKTIGLINQFQTREDLRNADLLINSFKELNIDKILNL